MSKRISKNQLEKTLEILANNLNSVDYSKVTSVMSLLFVGHQFGMSPDGFEFVNLAIKTKKNFKRKQYKKTLQGNVINLKLKR